jgi:hypothetical protein
MSTNRPPAPPHEKPPEQRVRSVRINLANRLRGTVILPPPAGAGQSHASLAPRDESLTVRHPREIGPEDISCAVSTILGAQSSELSAARLAAFRLLATHPALLEFREVAALVRWAEGLEAIQLTALVAARFSHVRSPEERLREELGRQLRGRARGLSLDLTAIVCILALDLHPWGWAHARRMTALAPFLTFDVLRTEVQRRPALALERLTEAAGRSRFAGLGDWLALLKRPEAWQAPCGCVDCCVRAALHRARRGE